MKKAKNGRLKIYMKTGSKMSSISSCYSDLRQDMLTLQLFKIMDRIWQNEGLDLG